MENSGVGVDIQEDLPELELKLLTLELELSYCII